MIAAAVMQAQWHAGQRRVRLFCAEELRPAACCIVDALHTRGYEVVLLTGPEAREGLQQPASAEVLRVIWAPEGADRATRTRLREALDPDAAGDVLVLAAATPRGVIEAIDAFGGPPRRKHLLAARRKTYLAQPTLMERKLEPARWMASALGAGAIAIALVAGLWLGTAPSTAIEPSRPALASDSMSSPKPRELDSVLASSRAELDLEDALEDGEQDEPIILKDVEAPLDRRRQMEPLLGDEVLDAAPLDPPRAARPTATASLLPGSGEEVRFGGVPGIRRVRAIDPF